jgi:hypothetical protein
VAGRGAEEFGDEDAAEGLVVEEVLRGPAHHGFQAGFGFGVWQFGFADSGKPVVSMEADEGENVDRLRALLVLPAGESSFAHAL